MPYTIFINGTQMLTLRPHQERIINRLQNYNKGQVIVPTGGGKTLTMIMDCLLYTSPSPRDAHESRMPSSA